MIALPRPALRSCQRATVFALLASVLMAVPAVASQSPTDTGGAPRITITDTELAPDFARTAGGYAFVLVNDSVGIARVEFQLRRGDGIACSSHGRTPRLARRFVLGVNESLVCHALTLQVH